MEGVGAAGRNHNHLGGLIELCRSAGGEYLELRESIERGDLRFTALQRDFLVDNAVERNAQAAVGVAATGAGRKGQAACGHLILRADALHAWCKCNQAHHTQAAIQRGILNRLRIDHLANGRIFGLNHRSGTCDLNDLRLRSDCELRIDLRSLIHHQDDPILCTRLESSLFDLHAIVAGLQQGNRVGACIGGSDRFGGIGIHLPDGHGGSGNDRTARIGHQAGNCAGGALGR